MPNKSINFLLEKEEDKQKLLEIAKKENRSLSNLLRILVEKKIKEEEQQLASD